MPEQAESFDRLRPFDKLRILGSFDRLRPFDKLRMLGSFDRLRTNGSAAILLGKSQFALSLSKGCRKRGKSFDKLRTIGGAVF